MSKKKFKPEHKIVNGRLWCGIMNCPLDILFFMAYFKAKAAAKESKSTIE